MVVDSGSDEGWEKIAPLSSGACNPGDNSGDQRGSRAPRWEQAIELATTACDLTGHEHPEVLYVLRAACADVGRFPEAVLAAELGIRAARAGGDEDLAESIRQPLEFYKQHKPFRFGPP